MDELNELLELYKKHHLLISDKNLALSLGLSNAYLCDIRKGRRRLSDKLIIKITGELNLENSSYLLAARFAYANEAEEKLAWKKLYKHYKTLNKNKQIASEVV